MAYGSQSALTTRTTVTVLIWFENDFLKWFNTIETIATNRQLFHTNNKKLILNHKNYVLWFGVHPWIMIVYSYKNCTLLVLQKTETKRFSIIIYYLILLCSSLHASTTIKIHYSPHDKILSFFIFIPYWMNIVNEI